MSDKVLWISIGILVLAGIALVVFPMIGHHGTPAWSEDGGEFLLNVAEAMHRYSLAHEGKMPATIGLLYPEYMSDRRVAKETSLFGKRRMAVIYWAPSRLGDPGTAVAQLVLDPSIETDYPWRSIVLWGDGHVRLHKIQSR